MSYMIVMMFAYLPISITNIYVERICMYNNLLSIYTNSFRDASLRCRQPNARNLEIIIATQVIPFPKGYQPVSYLYI